MWHVYLQKEAPQYDPSPKLPWQWGMLFYIILRLTKEINFGKVTYILQDVVGHSALIHVRLEDLPHHLIRKAWCLFDFCPKH
jgi:hypothetical protein